MRAPIDLGMGHSFGWIFGSAAVWEDAWPVGDHDPKFPPILCRELGPDGRLLVLTGIVEVHIGVDGRRCEGSVPFARPQQPSPYEAKRDVWTVLSLDPLDLEPSIQCSRPGCETHGHIRAGRWVG